MEGLLFNLFFRLILRVCILHIGIIRWNIYFQGSRLLYYLLREIETSLALTIYNIGLNKVYLRS